MTDLDHPTLRRIAEAALAETIPPGPAASETFRAAFDPPAALALIDAAERLAEAERHLRDAREKGLIYWEPQTDRGHIAKAQMLARIDAFLANANSPSPDPVGKIVKWLRAKASDAGIDAGAMWQEGGKASLALHDTLLKLADAIERRDWRKEPT